MKSAFDRIQTEYAGPAPGGATGYAAPGAGATGYAAPGAGAPPTAPGYEGPPPPTGVGGHPGYQSPLAPTERFSANRAYDKLAGLCLTALVCGIIGYFAVPPGTAYGFMIVAFVLVIVGWFRMRWARYLAPVYSVIEGLALGSVSKLFASFGHGIVPTAIIFTAAVFVGALALYRTGVVRVTPRMMSLAFMGALGILAVGLLSLLGLPIPGLSNLTGVGLVFSIMALGIAVLNLFTDFQYVMQSEARGVPAEAEWTAAFAMMTALVLVYISILRILGAAYGGGRRQ
jgi:uncharacterized YccA/Bax inhibitor family protein